MKPSTVSPRCVLVLTLTTVALLAISAPRRVVAQASPGGQPTGFGGLQWRSIGPLRGGRSIAVAGSAARPLEYYFGATGGGLWKTTDGGTVWRPVTDGQIASSSVGAVAVAPSNPDVVYVGMGETELRGNIIQGDGVYKSADGGKTWKHVGLDDTQAIAKIRVDPANPDVVFVAAFGHPYGPNDTRGVFRSTDGGGHWAKILFRDSRTGAIDLAFDPGDPHVLYAALWEASRTSYSLSSGGSGSGLFKSTDSGDHWTELTRSPGLPGGVIGKIGLAVSPADPRRVYAQIEAEDGGLFLSDDGGATWRKASDRAELRQRAFYYNRVYADPKARDTVYVLNVNLHKSTDAGKTWRRLRPPHGDNHDLWIAPDNALRMIEANDGGANVSVDGGDTWTNQEYPTGQMYHVITTTHMPYHVCGAQQDSTTACVSSDAASSGAGAANRVFYSVGGGESGYIASDPRNPDVFYAGSYGGFITRVDRSTGQQRRIDPYPDNPMGYSSADIAERFQWTMPIVLSPLDPDVLYIGSQHVWKSTDQGQSWTKISPDLTRHDPATLGPSGGPITKDQTGVETYATVFSIAPSPKDAGVIWTGSDDGLVFLTRDGGATWANVTPPALPTLARISLVEASPFRAGSAYVAANRYQSDDLAPYVYRTDDYGRTWTAISSGVAPGDFARAIREDPARERLLYLGTEHGVYVSFDDGARWESLRCNLPDTPVHDIKVEQRDLVIATHGRGFYVMDNIAPLRQWSGRAPTAELTVFTPDDVRRGLDRSLPIDYELKSDAQQVTVELLDAEGKVVKSFVSRSAAAAQERPADAPVEDETPLRPPDPKPSTAAGLNRLRWDLRYPGWTSFPGLIFWAASGFGPVAPPGAYAVRVTADGRTVSAPFNIRREPRRLAGVTDADLRQQFDLAIQVRDRVSAANDAVLLVRGIKDQLRDRVAKLRALKGRDAARAITSAEALLRKLSAVEEAIYQVKNRSSQDPLNYPIRLNNKLAALLDLIVNTDSRPTIQSIEVYRILSGQLQAQLTALRSAVNDDLPPLNALLTKLALERVSAAPARSEEMPARAVAAARPRREPLGYNRVPASCDARDGI